MGHNCQKLNQNEIQLPVFYIVYVYANEVPYVKVWVAHAPGIPGTCSPPPTSKETASSRSRHASRHVRDACVLLHVWIANPRWRGKRSRHSRCIGNPQFYVSGKRPMVGYRFDPIKYDMVPPVVHQYRMCKIDLQPIKDIPCIAHKLW